MGRLQAFRLSGHHTFWPDSLSLCEGSHLRVANLGGQRRLTDVYLLALAVRNKGRLATFDRNIPRAAVVNAEDDNLALIVSG